MKVFLSHKMNGLTEDEVMKIRWKAQSFLESRYGTIELIDNYHHDGAPENAGRVWHLGTSITMMDSADAVYFCDGWAEAKGCRVEKFICETYGLRVLNGELE